MDEKQEIEDNGEEIWEKGSFTQSMSPYEMKSKMRTFSMKHDEEMNYNCKECKIKISAHNRDWHDNMCDECFDNKYFSED